MVSAIMFLSPQQSDNLLDHLIWSLDEENSFFQGTDLGLVRLAGGWWLVLIWCERKILLAD
jgi:hypothetical protein